MGATMTANERRLVENLINGAGSPDWIGKRNASALQALLDEVGRLTWRVNRVKRWSDDQEAIDGIDWLQLRNILVMPSPAPPTPDAPKVEP